MLSETQFAPHFSLPDETGTLRTLKAEAGKWVVIYFYPKDNTPGCIQEACTIRDAYNEFHELGATVFGVSKDSVDSHATFKAKYQLPFALLSDETGEMIKSYGALTEKSIFGVKYMGIERMTYLIDPEGKVAKVYPKVNPTDHAHEILADLKALQ